MSQREHGTAGVPLVPLLNSDLGAGRPKTNPKHAPPAFSGLKVGANPCREVGRRGAGE